MDETFLSPLIDRLIDLALEEDIGPGDVTTQALILAGERVALNFLMRLSGIATFTHRMVSLIPGSPVALVDTRKTTPGWRALEKYAVRLGGGRNHRFGLYDAGLIKNNHLTAVGSITEAVRRARANAPQSLRVEVEVADLAGLPEALSGPAVDINLRLVRVWR